MAPQPDVETPDPFRCSRCKSHSAHGHCRSCKAHQRLAAILRLASAGNPEIRALFLPYGTSALHAQAKAGPFLGMSQRDINRIITAQTEQLCDQSVRYLGAWQ